MSQRAELAAKIREIVAGFLETAEECEWEPSFESEERAQILNEGLEYVVYSMGEERLRALIQQVVGGGDNSQIGGFIEEWMNGPIRRAMIQCRLPIRSAIQHMLALADSLESETSRNYVVMTLSRVISELSAKIRWLTDPRIDWRERIRRYVNDEISDLHDLTRERYARLSEESRDAINRHRENLLVMTDSLGIERSVSRGNGPTFAGKPPPNSTQLLEEVRQYSGGFYAMSSASLHGRGYALRRLMGEDGGFDWQDSEKRFSDKQLALELKPMVQMFFEGFTSFHMLHDWPKDSYLMPMIELPVILTQMEGVDLDALANQSDEELY